MTKQLDLFPKPTVPKADDDKPRGLERILAWYRDGLISHEDVAKHEKFLRSRGYYKAAEELRSGIARIKRERER